MSLSRYQTFPSEAIAYWTNKKTGTVYTLIPPGEKTIRASTIYKGDPEVTETLKHPWLIFREQGGSYNIFACRLDRNQDLPIQDAVPFGRFLNIIESYICMDTRLNVSHTDYRLVWNIVWGSNFSPPGACPFYHRCDEVGKHTCHNHRHIINQCPCCTGDCQCLCQCCKTCPRETVLRDFIRQYDPWLRHRNIPSSEFLNPKQSDFHPIPHK